VRPKQAYRAEGIARRRLRRRGKAQYKRWLEQHPLVIAIQRHRDKKTNTSKGDISGWVPSKLLARLKALVGGITIKRNGPRP
jgi:hypothetical protein